MNARRVGKLPFATALALAGVCAFCTVAAAGTGAPTVGTTQTVSCHFTGHGFTNCRRQTVIVAAGACWDPGSRLYSREEIDSVVTYRGNVVRPGSDGVPAANYGALLRPHARLVAQTRPHAFSETVPFADPSCTG